MGSIMYFIIPRHCRELQREARLLSRNGFTTSDHARGQGAGRFESAAYTPVCEHFERPATPPSGVRRGYETTSNQLHSIHDHREYMIHPIPFADQLK